MIKSAKTFKQKFEKWVECENQERLKVNELKKNSKPVKLFSIDFLKNTEILKSKFIYNMILRYQTILKGKRSSKYS